MNVIRSNGSYLYGEGEQNWLRRETEALTQERQTGTRPDEVKETPGGLRATIAETTRVHGVPLASRLPNPRLESGQAAKGFAVGITLLNAIQPVKKF